MTRAYPSQSRGDHAPNPILTQPVSVAIPTLQTPTVGTYAEPATATSLIQLATTTPGQPHQSQNFCALVMSVGRQYPNTYIYPYTQNGQIQERRRTSVSSKRGRTRERRKDLDSTRKKQKEQELKSNKSKPQTVSPLENSNTKMMPYNLQIL